MAAAVVARRHLAQVLGFCALLLLGPVIVPEARAEGFKPCPGADIEAILTNPLPGFKCVEVRTSKSGIMPWRIVRDAKATNAFALKYEAEITEVFDRAVNVWGSITPIEVEEVTVVPVMPESAKSATFAESEARALSSKAKTECIILLNPGLLAERAKKGNSIAAHPDYMKFVLAHELAHCVQRWRWVDRQDGADSEWWHEGVAEMLAAALYPDFPDLAARRFPGFNATIAKVPLTRQSYNSVVFFKWLWDQSPARIFDFMSAMPAEGTAGEQAQQDAVVTFVGGRGALHQFARNLIDGKIGGPGGPVPALPPQGSTTVTGSTDVPLGGAPFTVQSKELLIRDNDYMAIAASTTVVPRVRAGIGAWQELPEELKLGDCEGGASYRTGYFPVASLETKAHYKFIAIKACKKIKLSGAIAASAKCLFGKWIVDNDAYGAQLASFVGKSGKVQSVGGAIVFAFRDDGIAAISASNFKAVVQGTGDPPRRTSVIANATDAGKWSATSTKITYLAGGAPVTYAMTLEALGTTQTVGAQRLVEDGEYLYQCAGDALTLTYAGPIMVPADRTPRIVLRRLN